MLCNLQILGTVEVKKIDFSKTHIFSWKWDEIPFNKVRYTTDIHLLLFLYESMGFSKAH